LKLADGSLFSGTWEECVGTALVFEEEVDGEVLVVRYAGRSEWKLVMRRQSEPLGGAA
jgi:hypothetical protein